MTQWVLASSSPRRQELLKLLLADFEVVPSNVDESVHAGESARNTGCASGSREGSGGSGALSRQLELSVRTLWWFAIERF